MLKADGTVTVGAAPVDELSIKRSPDSATLSSDVIDNRKSRDCPKLEALRQIYQQICAIRDNHAQVVAENAAKRAEVCTSSLLRLLFKRGMYQFRLLLAVTSYRRHHLTMVTHHQHFYS